MGSFSIRCHIGHGLTALIEGSRKMSLADDIAIIKRQEAALQFQHFSENDAWTLGGHMRARALERKLPLVMDIRTGTRPLFYTALPGTTPENPDWVRRKINTVYRFEACSYRVGLELKQRGMALDHTRGVDPLQFAAAGGGFPIRIGSIVVGAVTVSGIPQRDDHNFVVESLAAFLGVAYNELALPPESD
jgi:uncharacterized protein (UPF0303 family)